MEYFLLPIIAIALDTLFVAYFRRLKQGQFNVTLDIPSLYRFETDLGKFQINRKHGRIDYVAKNRARHCPLSDVERIEFTSSKEHAFFEELLFGYDLTDLFEAYRDTIDNYVILVHRKNALSFPVFTATQYKKRDFWMGWYITLQEDLLERMGLFRNGYTHSMAAYMELRKAFAASGIRSGSA